MKNEFVERPQDVIKEFEKREKHARSGRPRKERRLAARLPHIPADRVCPVCGRGPILNSRSWVIFDDKVYCRSCHFKYLETLPEDA